MIAKIDDPYGKLVPGIASANDLVLNGPPCGGLFGGRVMPFAESCGL
jgi:hypothetical protein